MNSPIKTENYIIKFERFFIHQRIYGALLFILLGHTLFRHITIKLSHFISLETLSFIGDITPALYAIVYLFLLISTIIQWNKLNKLYINTFLIIFIISVIREGIAFFNAQSNYSLHNSILFGSALTSIKITLPLLFLTALTSIAETKKLINSFLSKLEIIILCNAILVVLGLIFGIIYFESYPLSGRWGYSGILPRGYHIIFSSIFLIRCLSSSKLSPTKLSVLFIALVCSGTKAGLLSIALIFLFVIIKSKKTRRIFLSLSLIMIFTFPKWIQEVVKFSSFWQQVYSDNGAWGIFFSLRNDKFLSLLEFVKTEYTILNFLFGKVNPESQIIVESLPIDYFVFFGISGTITLAHFFIKWLPKWKTATPLLIASGGGWYMLTPFSFIVWILWVEEGKDNIS